jgi:hypothetical protein
VSPVKKETRDDEVEDSIIRELLAKYPATEARVLLLETGLAMAAVGNGWTKADRLMICLSLLAADVSPDPPLGVVEYMTRCGAV